LHFLAQAVNWGHLVPPPGSGGASGLDLLGGTRENVQLMLVHGCDLDAPVGESATGAGAGFTALHLLSKPAQKRSRQQQDDVINLAQAILEHGGSVNAQVVGATGHTPLGIAASSGQVKKKCAGCCSATERTRRPKGAVDRRRSSSAPKAGR
jgi:hypothetical protein